MFKLTAATVLALLNATFAASLGECAVLLPAISNGALAPNAIPSWKRACNAWSSTVLPSDNTVTSVATSAGIQCTLLIVGTVNNLATVGFD
ncbi:hypothetical protein CPB85DRAFT_1337796, partial [Mucidula mucida]